VADVLIGSIDHLRVRARVLLRSDDPGLRLMTRNVRDFEQVPRLRLVAPDR
jgi:hypothetical protein